MAIVPAHERPRKVLWILLSVLALRDVCWWNFDPDPKRASQAHRLYFSNYYDYSLALPSSHGV